MKGPRPWHSPLGGSLAVAVVASLVLLAIAQFHDLEHLYVSGQRVGLNDQAGYITTARWLAETGELRSHLVYPAYVDQPQWRLYMPGQYWALAAAYKAMGDGPLTWRIPGLISFVVAAAGIFLIGRRLFDATSGWLAAGLFMLLPINGAFAFTAMPQLPFIALGVLAFCAFCYLPERSRALWVPFLLVPPFLMRETGALWVIPMAWLSMRAGRFGPLKSAILSIGGSVGLLSAVLAWQIHSGKGAVPLNVALTGGFNYSDAFLPTPTTTLSELAVRLPQYAADNLSTLASNAAYWWMAVEPVLVMVLIGVVGLFHSSRRFAYAVACMLLVVLTMVTFLYEWNYFRGTRTVLFAFPLCAVAAAPVLHSWFIRVRNRLGTGRIGHFLGPACLLPVLLWSARGAEDMASGMRSDYGGRTIETLESLPIDEARLFVCPKEISLDYAVAHYPIRCSFVPLNPRTLRLLNSHHEIGTLILRPDQTTGPMAKALLKLELVPGKDFSFDTPRGTRDYRVFHRPQTP